MKKKIVSLAIIFLTLSASICFAVENKTKANKAQTKIVEILKKLSASASKVTQISAKIEYVHSQPLFESRTVRNGPFYYLKDKDSSYLRINFLTIQQDDGPKQKIREDYIFDGFKFTKIDYSNKSVISQQLATDRPIEPFELVQENFPIVGFAEPAKLIEQYNISIVPSEKSKKCVPTLRLVPKKGSRFIAVYKKVDFKIDPNTYLPIEFIATTCDDEKVTIRFENIDTKKKIKTSVFEIKVPKNFTKTVNKAK